MKKIIMYSTGKLFQDKQTGGVKRFVELTRYLSNKFPRTILYSQDNPSIVVYQGVRHFIKMNSQTSRKYGLPPEASLLISNKNLLNELRKTYYNCIISFDVPPTIGLVLFRLKNIVLMIRKDMIGYELVNIKNKKYKIWFKIIYQLICESACLLKSQLVVCQCNYDKNVLKSRHPLLAGMIEKKTKILINNVNTTWIMASSASDEKPVGLPLKTSRFRICFIGGFDDLRKGQDLFLDTAIELLNEKYNFEFVLVGGGSDLEIYKQRYKHNNIYFTGRLNNPISVLKSSDLLVVPSKADSCPNTVLEALYNEIMVIGSRAGGIPEILNDENSLFELNVPSLKGKIVGIISEERMREEIRNSQLRRKKELTFDWAHQMSELILDNMHEH